MAAYLDHAATSPMRPAVAAAMAAVQAEHLGNPTGMHRVARRARRILDDARDVIGAAFDAPPGDVIFTSGGTEADNLAVFGAHGGGRVLCSAVEHPAVAKAVARAGGGTIAVDAAGRVDLEAFAAQLTDDVGLVSVMAANNETGVIQPLTEIAAVLRERLPGARLHVDAVQAAAWFDLPSGLASADLLSISAHKLGGPVGTGALVVRDGRPIEPLLVGGGQERERRSGTQDAVGAAGLAAAVTATMAETDRVPRARRLRDGLLAQLESRLDGIVFTAVSRGATLEQILPNICHVLVEGVNSETLLLLLDQRDVAAAAGSSCASGALERSGTLAAMGISAELARGSLRLSLGWSTTGAEIGEGLDAIVESVQRMRSAS